MKPHLVYRLAGATADGTAYVTDGAAIMRAALVEGIPSPEGVNPLTTLQIAAILQTVTTHDYELAALAPTTALGGVLAFRTPDGVYLSDANVRLLRALGPGVTLGTSGVRGVMIVRREGGLVGAVMPLAPPPDEPPAPPPPPRWRASDVFRTIQHARLLHWFDAGTWARLTGKLFVPAGGDPQAFFARLEALTLDEAQVCEAIEVASLEGRADFSPGGRAGAERAFVARVLAPEQAPAIRAAVEEMGAALGVPGVGAAIREPTSMASIHAALGRAFAMASRPESVFLVGTARPFILIREGLEPVGVFASAVAWEPDLGTLAGLPFVALLARELTVRGCTAIGQVAEVAFAADGVIPAFTVRVVRRELNGRPERAVFVVTDGLRARALETTAAQSVVRCEVLAWADRHDDALIATVARAGRTIHRVARQGGAAFYPGQSLREPLPGWGGWERLLATEMFAPMTAAGGAIDVLRLTPITQGEGEALRGTPGENRASLLLQQLEADFPALLARWTHPQPT